MKTVKLIIGILLLVLIIAGCKNKTEKNSNNEEQQQASNNYVSVEKQQELKIVYREDKELLKAYYEIPHIKEYYGWSKRSYTEQESSNFPADLSNVPYDELRLLRNEIFARNGYLFDDSFLRGYFDGFSWYMPIFDVDTFKVVLNKQESDWVNKILAEENRRKENKTVAVGDLNLFNSDLIVNRKHFEEIPAKVNEDFKNQNFSIVTANRQMPFYVYDENAYQYIPHYITTDLYLFILHKYFSRSLEKLDENYLYAQLKEILEKTNYKLKLVSDAKLQSTIEWAQMYNALALYAIGDSLVTPPERYKEIFSKEKIRIDNQSGNPIFIYDEMVEYNELKPRGHYTKSERLKKYFRGFKWISLSGINLKKDEELKGLILFAYMIKSDEVLLMQYKKYVSTIEKLAGKEDNLSLFDIVNSLSANSVNEALSDKNVNEVKEYLDGLDKERVKKVFGEHFQTPERDIKRVYFLSSTYSLSGEIFSKLVHIDGLHSKRPFPRGLDVPAVFGNQTAQSIIVNEYKDNDIWPDYLPKLKNLQKQFENFNEWDHNYGFKGVQTALASCSEQFVYPDFMKTDAYNRKELSTMLSSWTHIKHDLILYQEKPFAAECGQGGGPEPPQHYSYVEPNLLFWDSALELVNWMGELFKDETTFAEELRRIKELGEELQSIAYKEIEGKEITSKEYDDLHYVGGTIEYILLGLLETDHLPEREKSMALIADVYVYNGTNLNVAVGHADDIYAIVPIKGEYYIARGSVFSYYEFTGQIYNDEEWKEIIKQNSNPERPEWIKPIINDVPPLKGQLKFNY